MAAQALDRPGERRARSSRGRRRAASAARRRSPRVDIGVPSSWARLDAAARGRRRAPRASGSARRASISRSRSRRSSRAAARGSRPTGCAGRGRAASDGNSASREPARRSVGQQLSSSAGSCALGAEDRAQDRVERDALNGSQRRELDVRRASVAISRRGLLLDERLVGLHALPLNGGSSSRRWLEVVVLVDREQRVGPEHGAAAGCRCRRAARRARP